MRLTKKRGPRYHISPLRCGEIASHLEQFSGLSLSLSLLEYHGGLRLFHFIIVVNVFLVSFPGLTCSAWPSPFPCSPEPWLLLDPHLLHPAGSVFGAKSRPTIGLCFMCFARGGLPSPFQNILQHCLAFLTQFRQERRWKRLFGPESFGGVALNFVFIVLSRWVLLEPPVFGWPPTWHNLPAGDLP